MKVGSQLQATAVLPAVTIEYEAEWVSEEV